MASPVLLEIEFKECVSTVQVQADWSLTQPVFTVSQDEEVRFDHIFKVPLFTYDDPGLDCGYSWEFHTEIIN